MWDRIQRDTAQLLGRIVTFASSLPRMGDLVYDNRAEQHDDENECFHRPTNLPPPP